MHATMNELASIFPQHNKETITRIYNNVVGNSGEGSHDANVLPICIEMLLELPTISNNEDDDDSIDEKLHGNGRSLSDKDKETEHINDKHIFCLRDSKSSSSDNDDEQQNIVNVRNNKKPRPNYQDIVDDKLSTSSHSNYPTFFSDEDKCMFIRKDVNDIEKLSNKNQIPDSPLHGRKRKLNDIITNGNRNIKRQNGTKKIHNYIAPEKQDLSTVTKGMAGYLEICMEKIKAIINNVDNAYLEKLINEQTELLPVLEVVNNVVEYLLEHQNYPKIDNVKEVHPPSASTSCSTKMTSSIDDLEYNKQSVILLRNSFPKVPKNIIKKLFDRTHNYTKSFIELEFTLEQIISGKEKVEDTIIKSFLTEKKEKINVKNLSGKLIEEIEQMEKRREEDIDKLSIVDSDSKYEDQDNTINCGCCYNEVAFEEMVQCLDGHLFCTTCLQCYSKESIYGSGKVQLFCMTHGCDSTFPMSQLKKALQEGMMEKYMERVQNEDIKLANLHNLINCPNCDFAAEMDEGDKVFRCQNKTCMKESCRYCKEDWKYHFGLPCKEVEKKESTNLRVSYEEKMTQAKVRKCLQCCTIFLKSDGCNKMTCRCGAKMCYICRQDKIDYQHFCQHARNPDNGCAVCKKCSLWTDPSEDDDHAIAEIKKQAEEEERLKLNGNQKVSIGPDPSSSKNDQGKHTSGQSYDEYYGSSEDDSDDSSVSTDSGSLRCHSSDSMESSNHTDDDSDDIDVWELGISGRFW